MTIHPLGKRPARHAEASRRTVQIATTLADREQPQRGLLDLGERVGIVLDNPVPIARWKAGPWQPERGGCVPAVFLDNPGSVAGALTQRGDRDRDRSERLGLTGGSRAYDQ